MKNKIFKKRRTNRNFKIIMNNAPSLKKREYTTSQMVNILEILASPIVEKNGIILIERCSTRYSSKNYKGVVDKTGLEQSEHIHIKDFCRKREISPYIMKIGIYFAEILAYRLKNTFPKYNFRIRVGSSEISKGKINDCIVRFHRIRKDDHKYFHENLNVFKNSAILEYEI